MLSINSDDQIVIKISSDEWNLEDSESYAEFLIWVTTPKKDPTITKEIFELDTSISKECKPRAERYSEFLREFADRRNALLKKHEEEQMSFEDFVKSIDDYIELLSSSEEE